MEKVKQMWGQVSKELKDKTREVEQLAGPAERCRRLALELAEEYKESALEGKP